MSKIIVHYEHYSIQAMNFIFGVGFRYLVYSKCVYFSQFRKMSEQEEEFDAQNALDASEGDGAYEINIPAPSQEALEADQIEENESAPEPSGGGHETLVEEQNDRSTSNLEPNNEEQLVEEIMSPEQVLDSPAHEQQYLSEFDSAMQSTKRYSNDSYLTFLDKIKAVKESLKTSMQDSLATGIT